MNLSDGQETISWPGQQWWGIWIVVGLVGLAFVTAGMLWGLSVTFRGPAEVGYPVPGPTEQVTIISSWTERETEYVEGPPVPPPSPQATEAEVVPPKEVIRVVERPVPGPTRTVTEYRTVPAPTRTVTRHFHHHHEAPTSEPSRS
ncbi:MAG: hypothetical protein ABR592_08865 [Nitriliruptorales bacterium]